MTYQETVYKKIMFRIGMALLLHVILLYIPTYAVQLLLQPMVKASLDEVSAYVLLELLNGAIYLIAFMVPALFFYWISRHIPTQAMPLMPKVPPETPLLIVAGMAVILISSIVNTWMVSVFNYSQFSSEVLWDTSISADYQVVLMFVTDALVPAVCEEFLFRGMIMSNLKPFGRTTAIVGSAVLFSLMHANAEQTFYTFVAGLVLAWICDRTGSLWPGMLLHLFNNFFSVVDQIILERYSEPYATTAVYALEGALIAAGIVCLVIIILKNRKKEAPYADGAFEKDLPSVEGYAEYPVASKKLVRYFFSPTVIIFAVYSVGRAILYIVYAVMYYG